MRAKKTIQKEIEKVQTMHAVASVKCIEVVLRVLTENIKEGDLIAELDLEDNGGEEEVKLDEAYRIAEHARNWLDGYESRPPSDELLSWKQEATKEVDVSKNRRPL